MKHSFFFSFLLPILYQATELVQSTVALPILLQTVLQKENQIKHLF